MPTTRSRTSVGHGSSSAHHDIIDMLKEDHKRVKKSFSDFAKLDVHEDSEQCQALVEQTCGELELHATLEEELFYPAVRRALDEEDLVDEAEVEHMTLRMLIEQLKDMAPEEEKYAATFWVLGEYTQHHIKEEEEQIFTQLNRAKLDWEDLKKRIMKRREQLIAQFLPAAVAVAPPAAKSKTKTKEKDKSKGGHTQREPEDIEEPEEIADGWPDRMPYIEPGDDDE